MFCFTVAFDEASVTEVRGPYPDAPTADVNARIYLEECFNELQDTTEANQLIMDPEGLSIYHEDTDEVRVELIVIEMTS